MARDLASVAAQRVNPQSSPETMSGLQQRFGTTDKILWGEQHLPARLVGVNTVSLTAHFSTPEAGTSPSEPWFHFGDSHYRNMERGVL